MPATRCLFMQMLVVTSIACELGTVGLAGVFLHVSASHQLPLILKSLHSNVSFQLHSSVHHKK